jgi:opacity protein-like surface antigen
VDGAHLEDTQWGVNSVFGYRAGALVAFELEGEWLLSRNRTNLDINGSPAGSHTAEISNLWTITANVKAYPPFDGWLQPLVRFQPYFKVGLGLQHSELDIDIVTSGLSTTNTLGTITVPADFEIHSSETNLDGALRVGGGIEIYATRNIVSELNATYVVPFSNTATVQAFYVSVQWRLVYRF